MEEDYPTFDFEMVDFVTADSHFSHVRISELAARPFRNVEEMNAELIRRWNDAVGPEDTVLHLGDLALGPIEESVALTSQLNGRRFLVPGNHDRVSPATQTRRAIERFTPAYEQAGWVLLPEVVRGTRGDHTLLASHYPYFGDSHDQERHTSHRPVDRGVPLIHGHTHARDRGPEGHQFHVGVDAFNFTPVRMGVIDSWLASLADDSTAQRTVDGVRETLRMAWTDETIDVWLLSPNSFLDGAIPSNVLSSGDDELVLDAARQDVGGGYR